MTCTAASHQGAIKEPTASLFRICEAHPVETGLKCKVRLNIGPLAFAHLYLETIFSRILSPFTFIIYSKLPHFI